MTILSKPIRGADLTDQLAAVRRTTFPGHDLIDDENTPTDSAAIQRVDWTQAMATAASCGRLEERYDFRQGSVDE